MKSDDAGTYICTASNDYTMIQVPTMLIVTGAVPNFLQAPKSYIMLPPVPDAHLHFNIEVSFKPEAYDGLILYDSEVKDNGKGDFIVLSLSRGFPEFR